MRSAFEEVKDILGNVETEVISLMFSKVNLMGSAFEEVEDTVGNVETEVISLMFSKVNLMGSAFEEVKDIDVNLFICMVFYTVSTVFQLFNGYSSQIHVPWTIFNQYLTSPLSWHWQASHSTNPIILSAKGEATTTSFFCFFLRLWSVAARDRTYYLLLKRLTL